MSIVFPFYIIEYFEIFYMNSRAKLRVDDAYCSDVADTPMDMMTRKKNFLEIWQLMHF